MPARVHLLCCADVPRSAAPPSGSGLALTAPDRPSAGDPWLLAALAAAFACALYVSSLGHDFAFDDYPLIVHNTLNARLSNVPVLFASDFWAPHGQSGLYRPLATTVWAVERSAFGVSPAGYHALSVVLHGAVTALVVLVVWRLTRDRGVAAATGLLFGAHAVHTEAVAGIAMGQPDLQAALLALLAVDLHLRANDAERAPTAGLRAAALASFGLALVSKESAITLIGVVVWLDWLRADAGGRPTPRALAALLRARWRIYLGWIALALLYLGLRYAVIGALGAARTPGLVDNPIAQLSDGWRIANAALIGFRYVGLFLFPLRLSHDYSWGQLPVIESLGDPLFAVMVGLVLASVALVAWSWRRSPQVLLGLGLFAISFSIASNIVVPVTTMMAERLVYLPSMGLCLALAVLMRDLSHALPLPGVRRSTVFAAIMAVWISGNAIRTVLRVPYWENNETIRLRDVALHPRNVKLQTNAGFSSLQLGRPEDALAHFDRAIAIVGDPEVWSAPYRGRVWALIAQGRIEEARIFYATVRHLVEDPYIAPALEGRVELPWERRGP